VAFDKEMDSFRTISQLEDLRKEVLAQIKKIASIKTFPPNESGLCPYCKYQNRCPVWKHEIKLEKKKPNEYLKDSGVKLVNQYVKIQTAQKEYKTETDEKLSKLKEALIVFCKKNDIEIVVGSDNKISVKESVSVKFPGKSTPEREELVALLKKMKKLDEVTDLDTHALTKIVKGEEWAKDELKKLKKFEVIDKSWKLSVRKK
jgi:hypothetical protein